MSLSKSVQFVSKLTFLAAIALAVSDFSAAIAQQRLPAREAGQISASTQTVSVKELQEEVDTAWGSSSTEVRSRFPSRQDPVSQLKAGCATQALPACATTTQTIPGGFQSGQRRYNLNLNFDYDRLTSVLIQVPGSGSSNDYAELKQQLEAAYGPGTAKYSSPEGPEVTYWEWRLPTTTIGLNYLAGLEGSTELLYYPTPATSSKSP